MKTLIILILISITSLLNAQSDRILHSATLDCYMDLGKIVGMTDIKRYTVPTTEPDWMVYAGCWYFTIIYEHRKDKTYYFPADTVKAYQVYNRIVNRWKAYIEYSSPPQQLVKSKPVQKMWLRKKVMTRDSIRYIFIPFYIQSDTITLHKPLKK